MSVRRTWMTVGDAAEHLSLSPVTVRAAFRRGLLDGHRRRQGPWSRIYIDPVSVERYRRDHLAPGQRGRGQRREKPRVFLTGEPHEAISADLARYLDVTAAESVTS